MSSAAPARPVRVAGDWKLGVGLAALATLISVVGSWHVSLWTDEAATISAARRPLGELWRMIGSIDVVHGLYYAVMHFWVAWLGSSPFALRLPSALCIGIATGGVYVLARTWFDQRRAIAAAVCFAVLPRVAWAGIEARSYALTIVLATWATVLLLGALRSRRSSGYWVGYGLLLALAGAVNVYVLLLAGAHLISLWLDRTVTRPQRWRWWAAAGAAGLVDLPLLWTAAHQTGQLGGGTVGVGELIRSVVVNQWFLGDTPTTATGVRRGQARWSEIGSWWGPAAIGLAVLGWAIIALVLVAAWRARRRDREPVVAAARWLVPWLVLPTLVIGAYSLLVSPMYSPRYLTFATPGVAILLGVGVLSLRRRVAISVGCLLVVLVVPVYVSQRQVYGKNSSDWATVAGYVATRSHAGDAVYFTPRYPAAPLPVGQTTRGAAVAYPSAFSGLIDVTLAENATQAGNLTGLSRSLAQSRGQLIGTRRLWVLQRRDYPAGSAADDRAVLESVGLRGTLVWQGPLDQVWLYARS